MRREGHLKRDCPDYLRAQREERRAYEKVSNAQVNAVAAEQEELLEFVRQLKKNIVPGDERLPSKQGGIYSCTAVATSEVQQPESKHGNQAVYLDGSGTHHVVHSQSFLHGLRTSHINAVVTAGGEEL